MPTSFAYNSVSPLNAEGFAFNLTQLRNEINDNVLITTTLDKITGSGKEDIVVHFVVSPTVPEEAQINATVGAHVPDDASPALSIGFDANRFIFCPGGPEEVGPTVFSVWSDLVVQFDKYAGVGRRFILFDETFETPIIPAGSYDLSNTILEGLTPVDRTDLTVASGVTFTGLFAELVRIKLSYQGGSAAHVTSQAEVFTLKDSVIECTSAPLIQFAGAFNHTLLMDDLSELTNNGSFVLQLNDASSNLTLLVPAESQIGADTLADVPGANEMAVAAFGVNNVNPTQPNLANTILSSGNRKVLLAKASDYDPAGSVTPLVAVDVQAAIDELDFNFANSSPSYGGQHQYFEDESSQAITGTTIPQSIGLLTTASLPAGDYYIEWYIESAISSNNNVTQMEIEMDGTPVGQTEQNTRTSSAFFPTSGFAVRTLTSGVHTLEALAAPDQSGRTSFIERVRLRLHRIS